MVGDHRPRALHQPAPVHAQDRCGGRRRRTGDRGSRLRAARLRPERSVPRPSRQHLRFRGDAEHAEAGDQQEQLLRDRRDLEPQAAERRGIHHQSVAYQHRRPRGQSGGDRCPGPDCQVPRQAGGAHLSTALRRAVGDDHPVGRVPAPPVDQGLRAHLTRQVSPFRDLLRRQGDAACHPFHPLSLRRGAAHGRGHERPDARDRGDVRRCPADAQRPADPHRGSLEVRLQEHQVDQQDRVRGRRAGEHLDDGCPARVRLLLEREPRAVPSPVEPAPGEPHRRRWPAGDR